MVHVKTGVSIKTQNLDGGHFFLDEKALKIFWSQFGLNLVSNENSYFASI